MGGVATEPSALLAELTALPEGSRLDRLRNEGDPVAALLALAAETERLAAADLRQGLAAADLVVALADALGDPAARAEARRRFGNALAYAGCFDEALVCCEEAAAIAAAAALPVVSARARLAAVHSLVSLGRWDGAITAAESARATFQAADEPRLVGRADLNLGAVHDMREDARTALLHYDRARANLQDEPDILAQLESNRGLALMQLDDFAGAEAAFRAAVDAFVAAGLGWAAAVAEGNMASLAVRRGRLDEALRHFERGRRFLEDDEAPVHLARLLVDQADAYATLGLPEEARLAYAAMLPQLDERGLAPEAASARAGLGRMLLRLGRSAEAAPELDAAARAFHELEMPLPRARLDLARAELVAAAGFPAEARELTAGALTALADRPAEAALARLTQARFALAEGDLRAAEADLAAAMPTAEELDLAPLLAELHHLRALVRQARGDAAGAGADFGASLDQIERVRGTLQAERFRAAFLGNRLAIYDDALLAALDRGGAAGVAEAFAIAERAKGRALLDLVGGALDLEVGGDEDDPAEARLQAELATIQSDLNWHYSRFGDDEGTHPGATSWREEVHRLEAAFDALKERLTVAHGAAGLFAPAVDLAGAQALLRPGEALIEYAAAGDELFAFVVWAGEATVVRRLTTVPELVEHARRFGFQVARALAAGAASGDSPRGERLLADIRRELGALHELLLTPLLPALAGAERLVLVPHGPLHALPLHALWDGEHARYLIETAEVRYAQSASVLGHLHRATGERRRRAAGPALVVGVPDAAAPRIGEEAVRVVAALETGLLLLGNEATCEAVTAAARAAPVIHLACHGVFAPERPLGSGLKLADRWLNVRDIYGLRLRADLVTLSGCETGRATVGDGDELVGLVRGFLAAGAASLLLSLWVVYDASTADLMESFYASYKQGASAAAALRHAQLALLARQPHPAFWAPFVLGGLA